MAEGKRAESPMDRVWNFFISLRLAIFTIIILAIASIIGTIIEQNQPLEKYRQIYSDATIRLFDTLNLFDMYHSWWFLLLLVLFTVNLICCTVDRLPRAIKVVRNPKSTLDENLEKTLGLVSRWKKKGNLQEIAEGYRAALGGAFAKPRRTDEGGAVHLYAEKGVISRFGVYVTHLSIVIIFLGGILGNVFGFKGFVNIVEGQSVATIPTRGGADHVDLDFSVRCNRFWVEYYPNGQPKEYSSDLSVIQNGKEVLRKKIEVNDPLQYEGVWFYQSSYGTAGASTATVTARSMDGGRPETITLSPGKKREIPGYGRVSAIDYRNDFQGFGPALLVVLEKFSGGPPVEIWLLQSRPEFDKNRGDSHYLSFSGINEIFYTGLQVARDPGVNVVWAGCTLMVVGIMIAFFLSHQRFWIRLSQTADGRVEVVLAGSANKNRLAFEKKYEKIQADMKAVKV